MTAPTVAQKLDLALAALRGAGIEVLALHLTPADHDALRDDEDAYRVGLEAGFYRAIEIRQPSISGKSRVSVRLTSKQLALAPIGPRALARWLVLPTPWPPASEAAKRASA